ncbi:MAG: hypothetical protein ACRD9R_04625 [Pyrinomonadaceae bacterium]
MTAIAQPAPSVSPSAAPRPASGGAPNGNVTLVPTSALDAPAAGVSGVAAKSDPPAAG